jgi:dCTP deaminase
MILTGSQIEAEVKIGTIIINPFDSSLLNPNSYNFRIGKKIVKYPDGEIVDTKIMPIVHEIPFPEEGLILEPGKLYLGHTFEKMGSSRFVPLLGGRSSTGRLGLFVHITAPLGDIGYFGVWTLQLRATVPVKIYPGQKIGQMVFVIAYGAINSYDGKYQGGEGPQSYNPKGLFAREAPF